LPSPAEDDYDVHYVKLDIAASNATTDLAGVVTTKARVTATSMANYVFELEPHLTADSVFVNGTACTPSVSGSIVSVPLPASLSAGAQFTAQVYYHGAPVSGSAFSATGYNTVSSPKWGAMVTFTLSEPYEAFEWWPCKQSLRDKIDSCDIWITVPDSLKAGSNGILQAVNRVDATHLRYEWKERYPIDYYLISLAIANYVDYTYYVHFSGSTDSMPVQNYIYSNPATLPTFKNAIDSTGMMIDFFSSLYGRYPFWKEKYGHSMAPLSGGMEHQTMTTLGFFNGWLIAHELGHQWFGDNVTCGSWADIFMNEGFASYSEYLYIDHFISHTAALNDMYNRQSNITSATVDGTVYTADTSSEARIFDSRLSYDKGACVVHMLRFALNNDTLFFNILKQYQRQYAGSAASINDFKAVTETLAGRNVGGLEIDTFFSQWVYQFGYPVYDVRWMQRGSDVYVQLLQSQSFLSPVSLFYTPIELRLRSGAGDTVIRVFNNAIVQNFHFTWAKPMTTMDLDPNNWLIYQLNSVTKDTTLSVANLAMPQVEVNPNPAVAEWHVTGLSEHSELYLFDASGKLLWEARNSNSNETVPAACLPAGAYILKVVNQHQTADYRLMKQY